MQAVCIKAGATNRPGLGYVRPCWIINESNGEWEQVNKQNFPCDTAKVFITGGYEAIDSSFSEYAFFQITVLPNQQAPSTEYEFYCQYIAFGEVKPGVPNTRRLQDNEIIQLIPGALPSPNLPNIELDSVVTTNYVCIGDPVNIYGIFEKNVSHDALGIATLSVSIINSPLMLAGKYNKSVLKFERSEIPKKHLLHAVIDSKEVHFLHDIVNLLKSLRAERIDYLSNADIVRFGGDILEKTSSQAFKKSQIQLYQKNLATSKLSSHKPLLDKFFSIVAEADSAAEETGVWLRKVLTSEAGQATLKSALISHPDILKEFAKEELLMQQAEVDSKLASSRERQRDLDAKVRETEVRLGDLNRALQVAESEAAVASAKDTLQVAAQANAELAEILQRVTEAKVELAKSQEEMQKQYKLKSIEDVIRNQIVIREHIDTEVKDREERKARVEQELSAQEYELKKKLFEMKPYVEALTGFTPESAKHAASHKILTTNSLKDAKAALEGRDALIDSLRIFFKKHNRSYSHHEIANVLITTQQSFITVLAGLPGTGKTSLVRLYAEALGLKPRLLEVSVGRGWTSSRDLIGYFNPLVGKFQGSQTGFYNYLQDTKSDTFADSANSFVLLDEANLSPIEHYWSSFMSMSDDPLRRHLVFGNESLLLPKNLRFVATINYDNTTEPLSPRMIDRAPVISLSASSGFSSQASPDEDLDTFAEPTVYSANIMEQWFGVPSIDTKINGADAVILDEVDGACGNRNSGEGKPIILSHRKKEAIRQYCRQAYPIMRTERDNLAVDYAVSQHVLPLIDGQGEAYRARLSVIMSILEKHSLTKSIEIMGRVLESGKQDLDSYNFFAF